VRAGGLGEGLARHLPRRQLPLWLAAHALAMLLLGWAAWLALASALLVLALWRRDLLRRLGGTTGDTAGALVEMVEVTALVVVTLAIGVSR
jgi:adenosylcobinamide-GDP ribazoletransferase